MKKLVILLLAMNLANASNLSATTKAISYPGIGMRGQDIAVACQHAVTVTNPTTINEYPTITYQLCADNHDCQTLRYSQKVNNGTYKNQRQLGMYVRYRYPGHFRLVCHTIVEGLASQESVNDISVN